MRLQTKIQNLRGETSQEKGGKRKNHPKDCEDFSHVFNGNQEYLSEGSSDGENSEGEMMGRIRKSSGRGLKPGSGWEWWRWSMKDMLRRSRQQ
jgi:hypothetical protein